LYRIGCSKKNEEMQTLLFQGGFKKIQKKGKILIVFLGRLLKEFIETSGVTDPINGI